MRSLSQMLRAMKRQPKRCCRSVPEATFRQRHSEPLPRTSFARSFLVCLERLLTSFSSRCAYLAAKIPKVLGCKLEVAGHQCEGGTRAPESLLPMKLSGAGSSRGQAVRPHRATAAPMRLLITLYSILFTQYSLLNTLYYYSSLFTHP